MANSLCILILFLFMHAASNQSFVLAERLLEKGRFLTENPVESCPSKAGFGCKK
jgi:hypothetical protein